MVPHRHELSDEEWALLQPVLPTTQTCGRYYQEHHRLLTCMLFRTNTGIPWRDLPERYGPVADRLFALSALDAQRPVGSHSGCLATPVGCHRPDRMDLMVE